MTIAVALVTSFVASSAIADPTPAERAEARTLFEDGRAALKNGDYANACPKLEQSQRLDPGTGTLYNLASCYEGQQRLASAWTAFLEVAEAAKRADQAERETAARARVAALQPRLPHLRVTLEGPDRRTLTLDGAPFADGLVNTDVPVDPGGHELGADAPGKKHWALHIEATEATTVTASVPVLEDVAVVATPPTEGVPVAVPPSEQPIPSVPPPAPASNWQTIAAIVSGGLGVVGLGVGTGLGIEAITNWSDAKAQHGCPSVCTGSAYTSWSTANNAATASTVSFIVGGVLVATGAVLWFTRPKAPASVGVRSDGLVMFEARLP